MTYPAELYRLVHRGHAGDVAFYRRACAGADSVLELGCGWGRVLGAVAAEGRVAVGLELDRSLAAQARRALPASVHVVRGDMAAFAFRRAFARVIVPYSGLYNLAPDALDACLARVRAHLAIDGRLVFDVWNADRFHEEASPDDLPDDALLPVVSVDHAGKTWDVFERSRWDPSTRTVATTYVHVPRGGGETLEGTIVHRYFLMREIPALLGRAGLEPIEMDARGDELVVVTAHRSR